MLKKIVFTLSILLLLPACNGTPSGTKSLKEKAFEKITAFAEDGSKPAPSLQDYIDAEVTGVSKDKLADLNALVDSLEGKDVDTTEELNALILKLNNNSPTADGGANKSVEVNKTITLTGSASDSDGTIVSYEWKKGSTILATTASFEYTPSVVGKDVLTFTVIDNDGAFASDSVQIVVIPTNNQAPVANNITTSTSINMTKVISLMATDADGDLLTYVKASDPAHGTVSFTGGIASYTPESNYSGSDSFTYLVNDNSVDSNTATVTISVYSPLNDTGITKCANQSENNLDCPLSTHPNQDAQTGRDVTHNDDSDGHAGFSYTKISSTGTELPASATDWSCVKDNVTGLIWENKTDDDGLHGKSDRYNWYNTNNSRNGGSVGYADNDGNICFGYDVSDSATFCNTQAYVARINSATWCGASDWRLPTREELRSLVDYSVYDPVIDTTYYSATVSSYYWSSSPYAIGDFAWVVGFSHGKDQRYNKYSNYSVRLVRSGR